MVGPPGDDPYLTSAATGIAGQWRQLCAQFVALWSQVMKDASAVPPPRAAAVYAAGAEQLALLLAQVPTTAAAPGGWLDAALRACAAGSPPEAAHAVAALVRSLARCQAALAAFALAERAVVLQGCAAFGQRVAALAPPDRHLRTHLRLWIDAVDEAHADAARDSRYVADHAAVINALIDVTIALRAAGQQYVRAFDLPVRAQLQALENRIAELEHRLAVADAQPADKAKPKRRTRPAAVAKSPPTKARRRPKAGR